MTIFLTTLFLCDVARATTADDADGIRQDGNKYHIRGIYFDSLQEARDYVHPPTATHSRSQSETGQRIYPDSTRSVNTQRTLEAPASTNPNEACAQLVAATYAAVGNLGRTIDNTLSDVEQAWKKRQEYRVAHGLGKYQPFPTGLEGGHSSIRSRIYDMMYGRIRVMNQDVLPNPVDVNQYREITANYRTVADSRIPRSRYDSAKMGALVTSGVVLPGGVTDKFGNLQRKYYNVDTHRDTNISVSFKIGPDFAYVESQLTYMLSYLMRSDYIGDTSTRQSSANVTYLEREINRVRGNLLYAFNSNECAALVKSQGFHAAW